MGSKFGRDDLRRITFDGSSGPLPDVALKARPEAFTVRRFRFRVVEGPELGKEHVSNGLECAVGAAEGNQLALTDPTVSRHHMVVSVTPKGFLLKDVGSRNGTTVDGITIEAGYLRSGAIVGVGSTRLLFEVIEGEINEPLAASGRFGDAVGVSPAMRRLFALLPRIAETDATVLLEGETGTGKGLIAECLHQQSPRASRPFIVVDCGAIPPALMESELFGHERGAFTGATSSRMGAFEAAQGGTVFLDEIGELPIEMQPKLLRALDRRMIVRVGSNDTIALDVRVVSATNRDLRQDINRGRFRADLFYRLNILNLRIPSLAERKEDVPHLIEHFYEQLVGPGKRPPVDLAQALASREWPGNVRELRNAVERMLCLQGHEEAMPAEVTPAKVSTLTIENAMSFEPGVSFRSLKENVVGSWERVYLRELVKRAGGNVSRAARAARMDRNHLRDLLRRHNIQASDD